MAKLGLKLKDFTIPKPLSSGFENGYSALPECVWSNPDASLEKKAIKQMEESRIRWEAGTPDTIREDCITYVRELNDFRRWRNKKHAMEESHSIPVYAWRTTQGTIAAHHSDDFEQGMACLADAICRAKCQQPYIESMELAKRCLENVKSQPRAYNLLLAKLDVDTICAMCEIVSRCRLVEKEESCAKRIEVYKEALSICPSVTPESKLYPVVNDMIVQISTCLCYDFIAQAKANCKFGVAAALCDALDPSVVKGRECKAHFDKLRRTSQDVEVTFEEALGECLTDWDRVCVEGDEPEEPVPRIGFATLI